LSGLSFNAGYQRLTHILSTGAVTLFYEVGCELGKDVAIKLKARFRNSADINWNKPLFHHRHGKNRNQHRSASKNGTLKQMTVKIKDKFPPIALDKTGRAECHITRGYLVGGAEALTGKQWVCEEPMCLCKNDPYCEFKLKRAPVKKRQA